MVFSVSKWMEMCWKTEITTYLTRLLWSIILFRKCSNHLMQFVSINVASPYGNGLPRMHAESLCSRALEMMKNILEIRQESRRLEFLYECACVCISSVKHRADLRGSTHERCMHRWWWHVGRFTFKNIAKIFDYSEADCILNVKLLWNGGFGVCWVSFLNLHFSTN